MAPTSLDAFMARARARCAPHRNGVGGYCLSCFLSELEAVLLEGNSWMKRADAFELVQEWRAEAGRPLH